MKNIKLTTITILILISALSFCKDKEPEPEVVEPPPVEEIKPFPVRSEGVGPFKVGRTAKKLKEIIEKREKLSLTSEEGGLLEIAKQNAASVKVKIKKGKAIRVICFANCDFNGLMIGSEEGEVMAKAPGAKKIDKGFKDGKVKIIIEDGKIARFIVVKK